MIYLATYSFGPYEGDIEVYIEIDSELEERHLKKCLSSFKSSLNKELKELNDSIDLFKDQGSYDDSMADCMDANINHVNEKLKILDSISDKWISSNGKTISSLENQYYMLSIKKIKSIKL